MYQTYTTNPEPPAPFSYWPTREYRPMSRFYSSLSDSDDLAIPGCVVGSDSGLETSLKSSEGCVAVRVYEGETEDGGFEDRVRICFKRVKSWPPEIPPQFVGQEFILYEGPLSECLYEGIRTNTQEVEK